MVEGFEHEPGVYCGSVAMADVLRWAGIELSEPMVFGLGSGLAFHYLKGESLSPSRQVRGRALKLESNVAEALGLELLEHHPRDRQEAWRGVREALEAEVPLVVHCDLAELPYWETDTSFDDHRIVVAGYDSASERVRVADTHFEGLQTIDRETLHRARASKTSPSNGRQFAWWRLESGEPAPLEGAIRQALRRNAEQMRDDASEAGGLAALRTFRDEVADWIESDDAARSYRFAYECIEKRGAAGTMFRDLYQSFLSEASEYVPELARFQIPISMSRNADAWSTLATYLKAMALFLETEGEEPGENPRHHVESMAEAVYQFETTFWQRVGQLSG